MAYNVYIIILSVPNRKSWFEGGSTKGSRGGGGRSGRGSSRREAQPGTGGGQGGRIGKRGPLDERSSPEPLRFAESDHRVLQIPAHPAPGLGDRFVRGFQAHGGVRGAKHRARYVECLHHAANERMLPPRGAPRRRVTDHAVHHDLRGTLDASRQASGGGASGGPIAPRARSSPTRALVANQAPPSHSRDRRRLAGSGGVVGKLRRRRYRPLFSGSRRGWRRRRDRSRVARIGRTARRSDPTRCGRSGTGDAAAGSGRTRPRTGSSEGGGDDVLATPCHGSSPLRDSTITSVSTVVTLRSSARLEATGRIDRLPTDIRPPSWRDGASSARSSACGATPPASSAPQCGALQGQRAGDVGWLVPAAASFLGELPLTAVLSSRAAPSSSPSVKRAKRRWRDYVRWPDACRAVGGPSPNAGGWRGVSPSSIPACPRSPADAAGGTSATPLLVAGPPTPRDSTLSHLPPTAMILSNVAPSTRRGMARGGCRP